MLCHRVLLVGLHQYFGLKQDSKIALVGHSHLMLGVNKLGLEEALGQPITKYTSEGVNVADRQLMINYLLQNNPQTQYVVYGVDAWMFTGEGLSQNSYKLFYPFMDDRFVAKNIKQQATTADYWSKKLIKSSRYSETQINSAIRGHLRNWSNFKIGVVDTLQLQKNIKQNNFRKINSTQQNRALLEDTLKWLTDQNIQVILVYVPTINYINEAEPQKFEAELAYFRALANHNPQIHYLEYLTGWHKQHHYFFDPIHLNPTGQQAFTSALATDLKAIME